MLSDGCNGDMQWAHSSCGRRVHSTAILQNAFFKQRLSTQELVAFLLRTPQPSKMDLADLLNSRPAKGKRPAAKRVRKAQGKARKQCQGSKKRPAKAMPATLSHSGEDDVECCLLLGCQHRFYLHVSC